MGTLTTGIGLISGIDTGALIDALITLASGPKVNLQNRLATLQGQQSALLDINARLLNLKSTSVGLRTNSIFQSALATSSDETVLTATASGAQAGTYSFLVKQLVSNSQKISRGFTDRDTSPVGLTSLSFELGNGKVSSKTQLADLNGGDGVRRGKINITDTAGQTATIDLSTATTIDDVLDAINDDPTVGVTASIDGDRLVVTDNAGGAGTLTISDATGYYTATDLGIAAVDDGAGDQDGLKDGKITGAQINRLGDATALSSLNDGTGVVILDGSYDFKITARDGREFEIDLGRTDNPITGATLIEDLNNGAGVTLNADSTEDIQFVDRDGVEHDVDLTGIVTVQDFIDRVNDQTDGAIQITVHADGDKFTVTDTTGGSGLLKVLGAGPNETETAEDLGILEEDGVDADTFDGTALVNADHTPAARTIEDVIDRINNAKDTLGADNAGHIVASIAADGVSLQIEDTLSGGGNLIIEASPTNAYAARDLGIEGSVAADTLSGERLIAAIDSVQLSNLFGGSGVGIAAPGDPQTLKPETLISELLTGSGLRTNDDPFDPDIEIRTRDNTTYELEVDGLTTVQDLIVAVDQLTGGNVTFSIEGQAIRATDNTGGTATNFRIRDINGSNTAKDLGIEVNDPVYTVLGDDLDPIHQTDSATFTITDRSGATATIDLNDPESLSEVIDAINDAGIGVTASFNDAGNGVLITDTTGATTSNLIIADTSGTLAADLGITGDVADDSIRGSNLQLRYVAEGTALSELNYRRGIGLGEFRITDGEGDQVTIKVDSDLESVYDLINEINAQAGVYDVDVTARVNDNGDGIQLDNDLGSGLIQVDSISGSSAADLNLLGQATVDGDPIDGSYEAVVTLNASDTVDEIVEAINDAGIPVNASVLNTGAGPTPFQIVFSSEISGLEGDLSIDDQGFGLALNTLSEAQNAEVFFGAEDPALAVLIQRSTNALDDVLEGVNIDLVSASDETVTLTVSRDTNTIEDKIAEFAAAFNDAVGRIDQYDFYNVETEEKGVLLGNPTTAQIRNALFRTVQQKATGVETRYQYLSQVGLTVGAEGVLQFDRAKFSEAYETDPEAVENLFTAFQGTTTTTEEIAEGVTIEVNEQTYTQLGFGDLFDQLMDGLTNSIDGTMTLADEVIQDQIDLTEARIEDYDERLDAKRARLEREFAAMEAALAQLQSQSNALLSLVSNLTLTQASLF